jgi:hypothetical protein
MSYHFQSCTPEETGIPSTAIINFLDRLDRHGIELHSLMIVRHKKVCAKAWWKPYAQDIPHPVASFAKSIASLAIGFAEQEGLLTLDEKIAEIFPDKMPCRYAGDLDKMTIAHMLKMSSGHDEDAHGNQVRNFNKDWIAKFLSHPLTHKPGTTFCYSDTVANILSAVITRKTGIGMFDYLQPRLFAPLDIKSLVYHKLPDGITDMAHGNVRLTTEDMAKIALLILERGMLNTKRLLREDWFSRATTAQITPRGWEGRDLNAGYGYLFWQCAFKNAFMLYGAFSQCGVILPEQDTVVVFTAGTSQTQQLLDDLWHTVAADMSPVPLEKNAHSEILSKRLGGLAIAPLSAARAPKFEAAVNRKRFKAADALKGMDDIVDPMRFLENKTFPALTALTFHFCKADLDIRVHFDSGAETLQIGLENEYKCSSFGGHLYAAVGRWRTDHTFEAEIRDMANFSGARVTFQFRGNSMVLTTDFAMILDRAAEERTSASYRFYEDTQTI